MVDPAFGGIVFVAIVGSFLSVGDGLDSVEVALIDFLIEAVTAGLDTAEVELPNDFVAVGVGLTVPEPNVPELMILW